MTLTDGARGRTASFREQVAGRARGASDPMLALAIFVPLLILYIATANVVGDSLSPDPVSAAVASWHWTIHHNFHLEDQIRPGLWLYVAKGHIVTNRTPGVVLFGIPFYELLGRGPILSMFPAAVAGATSAAGAVTLLVLALRRLLGNRIALVTGLILALGTSTWSISADSLWTHGPNELLLAAAMYAFSRNRQLAAALFLGLACTVRPHLAFVPLVAGVWYAARRRSVVPLAVFGVPAVVGVGVIALWNHWLLGSWSIEAGRSYASAGLSSVATGPGYNFGTNVLGTFFSPNRGLVIWCPLFVVLLAGVRRGWRDAPDWARICSIGGIGYLLLQLKVNYFSGGTNFWSYRFAIEPLLLATPLLAYAARDIFRRRPLVRRFAIAAAAYCVGTQAVGALFFGSQAHVLIDPWTHFGLASELVHDGLGPRIVMGLTAATVIAAVLWRPRTSDQEEAESLASPAATSAK